MTSKYENIYSGPLRGHIEKLFNVVNVFINNNVLDFQSMAYEVNSIVSKVGVTCTRQCNRVNLMETASIDGNNYRITANNSGITVDQLISNSMEKDTTHVQEMIDDLDSTIYGVWGDFDELIAAFLDQLDTSAIYTINGYDPDEDEDSGYDDYEYEVED
jgi:hypothetical protein